MSDVVYPNLENPIKAWSHGECQVQTLWKRARFNLEMETSHMYEVKSGMGGIKRTVESEVFPEIKAFFFF